MTADEIAEAALVVPDAGTDPGGYLLAAADLREKRIAAATQGTWAVHDGDIVSWVVGEHGFDDDLDRVIGDPAGWPADHEHIAAEANPYHALAEVALWRAVAAEHAPKFGRFTTGLPVGDPEWREGYTCSCSGVPPAECSNKVFRAAVGAAQAYLTGAGL